MKRDIIIFVLGMITMLVLVLLSSAISNVKNNGYPGLTIFEKDAGMVNAKQIKVFHVIETDLALAYAKNTTNENFDPNEIVVLIIGNNDTNFYDDQKINIPKNKKLVRIGSYKYTSRMGSKTVPAVIIK